MLPLKFESKDCCGKRELLAELRGCGLKRDLPAGFATVVGNSIDGTGIVG